MGFCGKCWGIDCTGVGKVKNVAVVVNANGWAYWNQRDSLNKGDIWEEIVAVVGAHLKSKFACCYMDHTSGEAMDLT